MKTKLDRFIAVLAADPGVESATGTIGGGFGARHRLLRLVVRVLLAELLLRRGDQAEIMLGVLEIPLGGDAVVADQAAAHAQHAAGAVGVFVVEVRRDLAQVVPLAHHPAQRIAGRGELERARFAEIGRASCRERV